ncbi:TetR family transcriptional regulator [Paenibacillus cellulosilyticus]|uniref:TetR family transcriptional regulator n=1 Tax=Paenibacillus cellulosilyticus TaxID=375489 RepID=A0A2V2YC16_9BACL|nr:TetR/AcrR family transcriptional regulator [Paenibacillus cellulosilyticus]PWV89334.1 TetR family transcriptional regulator [Paenibacillus cellulosilyticus]QKS45169.1 TetR/AcrR family transcriptional regulator [Paenibacillus cellulosilyticus]
MDHTKPRTDPRIVRTRQLLKDAFIDLLEEMEIEKISVNRIAERATINRVTFYLHYRDIPDMMDKMADEMVEDMQRALDESPPIDSDRGDSLILLNLLEHIADNAKFYKVILGSRRTPVFTERMLKMLSDSVKRRIEQFGMNDSMVDAGIQKDVAIWYGSAALIGTIVAWLRNDMPYTPTYLAKQFTMLRAYPQWRSTEGV